MVTTTLRRPSPLAHPSPGRVPSPATPAPGPLPSFDAQLAALPLSPRVSIDVPGREIRVDGALRQLTLREFDLLTYLAGSAGRVVSRQELLRTVWAAHDVREGSRTVDVHVRRIREKTGLAALITTVPGQGYRVNAKREITLLR